MPINLDHFRLDRCPNGCRTRAILQHRHFANIAPGREVGEKHWFSAHHLLNHHRTGPDHEDIDIGITLIDDRLTSLHVQDLGSLHNLDKIFRFQARTEHLQQLPLGRDIRHRPARSRHRRHQFQGCHARYLNRDQIVSGANSSTAAAPGYQSDFAENRALLDFLRQRRIGVTQLHQCMALRYAED